jgi:hypothetical protein
MASFNPNDYETVEERLRRFWADEANADARVITINHTSPQDRSVGMWVVETRIYLSAADQASNLPKATGWAYELDGGKGANLTSALENCETSSIGRCLANMNYSGNKRASREEMNKVAKGQTPNIVTIPDTDIAKLVTQIAKAASKDDLKKIWESNAPHLDQAFTNSLGDQITLKQLILAKKEEVDNA